MASKILENDLLNKGVLGMADKPGLSAKDMQYKFEEIQREIIIPKLNEVIGEVGSMLSPFDNEKTYAVGEYCIYKDELYKCIDAVTIPGTWNDKKWGVTTLSDALKDLQSQVDNAIKESANAVAEEAAARKAEIAIERARIDSIAKLPEGSTTGDAELIDGRVDYKGNTHTNIGAHIREVSSQLSSDLADISNTNLFDISTCICGYRLSVSGVLAEGDKYFTSDYINVDLGLEYSKNSPIIDVYHRICLYNSNKVFIRSIDDSNMFVNTDASFVRFCGLLTELNASVFRQANARDATNRKELGELNDDYKELKKNVYDYMAYYKKSSNYTVSENHGWNANGNMTDSDVYDAVKIEVIEGKKLGFSGSFGSSAVCLAKRFDGVLERINIDGDYSEDNLYLYTVGSGVKEVLLCVRNKNHNEYMYPFTLYTRDIFECVDRIISSNLNEHFYSIAHQGYIGYGAVQNTLQAFVDAGRCGKFNGIETDARLTSDNIFVLNHDDYIDVSGTKYTITEKTYAELKVLKPDICTLEECIKVCKKYGLFICIDKLIYSTIEENKLFLFPLIRKYRMFDDVIFTSAVSRIEWTQEILNFYPKAKIGFYYPNEWFTVEQLSKAKEWVDGANDIFIFCNSSALTDDNFELFYENCDGVKIGTSAGQDLDLYKSLFYKTDYIDSNLYGCVDCV